MNAGDIAAVIAAATTMVTAIGGVVLLFQKKSRELADAERHEMDDCSRIKRIALRIIRQLREILAEAGIPEPEGIDDELGVGRHRTLDRSPQDE